MKNYYENIIGKLFKRLSKMREREKSNAYI